MSIIGINFGNESCAIAVARNDGIDLILTEESKYETPTIVCFGNKQRFFGAAGASSAMTNPNNTISQIKRLVGRKFSDPNLQHDLQHFPFSVTEGPDGFPLIRVTYSGEQHTFTPTQVLAMVFAHLKKLAERNLSGTVSDCCIGIPVFFTDIQRRAVLEAAKIAELNAPCLIHEMTAVALGYGIYTTDLLKSDKLNVAFVDVGHASMQICIIEYKSGHLKVLGHAFDQSLGGRDFDRALFEHFAAKFEKEHNVDVYRNVRACARLMSACEKTKKVLSANPVAHINIECFMNEKDMNYEIKREEFEDISSSLLQRVAETLAKALQVAHLLEQQIDEVEVVGSGSQVPAVAQIFKNFFKKEPRRTMNSSECVARGCALHCASLSPAIRVRELKSEESFPFAVAILWRDDMSEMQETRMQKEWRTLVFPSGCPTSSPVLLKFDKSSTFSFDVIYGDRICVQSHKFSTYTTGPFSAEKGETYVSMLLNYNGIVSVTSATLNVEEDEDVFVNGELVNGVRISKIVNNAANTEARAGATSYLQDYSKDREPKGKVKIDVPISEHIYGGLSSSDLQNALAKEHDMAWQDKMIMETEEKKNTLESYIFNMRELLNGKFQDFVGELEKELLVHKLEEIENWLNNEGADVDKSVYIAQLEGLKELVNSFEARYKEDLKRETVFKYLMRCLEYYREIISSGDTWWNHIDPMEKEKVINECNSVEQRLSILKNQQDQSPKYEDPVLSCTDLKKAADDLKRSILSIKRSQQNPQESSPLRVSATLLLEDGHPVPVNGKLVNSVTEFIAEASANVQAIKKDLEPKGKVKIDIPISEHIYGGLSSLDFQNALEKEYDMACKDKVVLETKERCLCNFCIQLNDKYQDFIGEQEKECFAHKLKETDNMLNDAQEMNVGVTFLQTDNMLNDAQEMTSRAVATLTDELLTDAPPITQLSVSTESEFDVGIPLGYISDPSIDQCDLDNAAALIRCFGSRLEHDLPLDEVVKRVQKVTKMLVCSGVTLTGWVNDSRSLLCAWKLRNQAIEHDKLIKATEASMVLQSQYVDDLRAQRVSIDGELSTKNLSLSSFKEESALIQSKINQTKAELDELQKKFAHVTHELDEEAKLCIHLEGRRRDFEDQLSTAELKVSNSKKKLEEMKSDRKCDVDEDTANIAVEQAIKNISSLSYGVAGLEKAVEKECALNYQAMEEPKKAKMVLKANVYNMRQLHGKYKNSMRGSDNERFAQKLKETEDWLSSVGEEVDEGVYIAKVDELVKILEVRKKDLPIDEQHYGALSSTDLENFVVLAKKDILMIETKERKNTLESYVYKMREEFNDKYKNVLEAAHADRFDIKLQEIESWLYGEGEDADKNDYIAKLEELKEQGNSMETLYYRLVLDAARHSLMEKIDGHNYKRKSGTTSGAFSIESRNDLQAELQKHYTDWEWTLCKAKVTTEETRKALQDYVLNLQNELNGKYREVSAKSEKQFLDSDLQKMQIWLNKNADKWVYIARLRGINKQRDFLEVCYKKDLIALESELIDQLNAWRSIFSDDREWDCISKAEKQKVLEACNSAEQLLSMKERQGLLPELVDLKSATQELNGLYERLKATWEDSIRQDVQ